MSSPLFGRKRINLSHNIHDYKIESRLGGGGFGSVELANYGGHELVLKRVQKCNNTPTTTTTDSNPSERIPKGNEEDFIQREIEAGRRLHHKGIAQLYDHFEDNNNHYFAMEYVKGGDLFTVMDERSFEPLRESEVKHLFRQIVRAVQYSHSRGVYHLDLKLENILVTTNASNRVRTKIIDFGLCHIASEEGTTDQSTLGCNSPRCEGGLCRKWAGSPDYCCPEILVRRAYSPEKADVWSLGVILYILLFAELPFARKERYSCLRKGRHPAVIFNEPKGDSHAADASAGTASTGSHKKDGVSEVAKDLILQMLQVDPSQRLSIDQIIKHKFLRSKLDSLSDKLFNHTTTTATNKLTPSYPIKINQIPKDSSQACASSLPGSPAIASAPMGK